MIAATRMQFVQIEQTLNDRCMQANTNKTNRQKAHVDKKNFDQDKFVLQFDEIYLPMWFNTPECNLN